MKPEKTDLNRRRFIISAIAAGSIPAAGCNSLGQRQNTEDRTRNQQTSGEIEPSTPTKSATPTESSTPVADELKEDQNTTAQESFGAKINEISVDRQPAVITSRTTRYVRPGLDITTNFGAPMSSNLLIEVVSQRDENRTIDRVSCIARDTDGNEVKKWVNPLKVNIEKGTYTYRTMINPRPQLPPGSYEIEARIETDTKQGGHDFEPIDTSTIALEVKSVEATPIISPSSTNVDDDSKKENALGKQYQAALSERDPAVRFFKNALDIVTGLYANDTAPSFGVDRKKVNELAGKTARARLRSSEDGIINIFWENRQRKPKQTPISIWYDRAVITARIPDSVTIEDTGGADYVTHNQETNSHVLMWVQPDVGHGIKPKDWTGATFNFAFNNPTGKQQFQLASPTGESQEFEVKYSVSLELGPLRSRSEEPIHHNIAKNKPISEMTGIYDFEKWKKDPQSVYWMSIGLTQRKKKVKVPGQNTMRPPKKYLNWIYKDYDGEFDFKVVNKEKLFNLKNMPKPLDEILGTKNNPKRKPYNVDPTDTTKISFAIEKRQNMVSSANRIRIYTGGFKKDTVVESLMSDTSSERSKTSKYTQSESYKGYEIYEKAAGSRTVGVKNGTIISAGGGQGKNLVAAVKKAIDTEKGEHQRYVDKSKLFERLTTLVGQPMILQGGLRQDPNDKGYIGYVAEVNVLGEKTSVRVFEIYTKNLGSEITKEYVKSRSPYDLSSDDNGITDINVELRDKSTILEYTIPTEQVSWEI